MPATNLTLMVPANLHSRQDTSHLEPLISPPAAFRGSQETADKRQKEKRAHPRGVAEPASKLEPASQPSETHLSTCLTRTRRQTGGPALGRKRTSLEQNVVSGSQEVLDKQRALTNCRFKAQVTFESDTDSQSNSISSNLGPKKELVSQTSYARTEKTQSAASRPDLSSLAGKSGLQPDWDYSLRVNRMRGSKVDSKVR